MTINTKISKTQVAQNDPERLFKLLESIDWKLWEMYNMMKKELGDKGTTPAKKVSKKTTSEIKV